MHSKRFLFLALLLLAATIFSAQAFAIDNVVETTFFGNMKDDGEGCGVFTILNLIIDILSIGVGILAIIGITIVGIKYLTAKGNIEQTKKAKHRLFQIVIGLVAYALLYTGVQWLLPGGKLNTDQQCTTISDSELASLKDEEQQEKKQQQAANTKTNSNSNNNSNSSSSSNSASDATCMKKAAKVVRDKICTIKKPTDRISETARLLAWPAGTSKSKYYNYATSDFTTAMKATGTNKGESGCRKSGKACGMFVGTVVRAAGIDPKFPTMASRIYPYVRDSKNWKQVSTKNPQPGDISLSYFSSGDAGHVSVYVKNKKGKTVTAQASLCDFYGILGNSASYTGSSNKTYRYVGK